MRVYLDGQPLLGPRSGIARYVKNLFLNLDLQHPPDEDYVLAFNRIFKSIDPDWVKSDLETDAFLNRRYPYKMIRRLGLPGFLYQFPYDSLGRGCDLFHGTNYTYYPVKRGKSVITIHDMAWFKYPETTSERIYRHHAKWVPYSARKADRIIADSRQTKRDIVELLHVDPAKVDVVHLAADRRFVPLSRDTVERVRERCGLPERYVLFVGTVEPRKNLSGLLQAFQLLKRNADVPDKLVIVGAKGWKSDPLYDWVQDNHLADEIVFPGFVEDADLPAVYNGAALFAFPSLYEGFGIPVLEAMQCGVPVIASNMSSIPEVAGDAGILLDPHDREAWAAAMAELLTDEAKRTEYARRSLAQAERFTWEATARATRQVYLTTLQG